MQTGMGGCIFWNFLGSEAPEYEEVSHQQCGLPFHK